MRGIIDSHIHAYSDEVIADPVAWAERRNESFWAEFTAKSRIQGWSNCEETLRDMDKAGVEVAVLQGWYWENQSTCDEENAWHQKWVKAYPDRFVSLASIQPRAGKIALESLKTALENGFHGVGELHPGVQGWSLDSDTWNEIAELCVKADATVCFHVTEPVGRTYAGKTETPLEAYAAFAKRMPGLKIVLAHWGGGMPFFMLNKWSRKDLANVYYDTAASPLVYTDEVWKNVVGMAGADRILFGTDYPLRVYPKNQAVPDFTMLAAEAGACLPPEAREAAMADNAARIYRIDRG
jgi:predicted TIM-barrel fold metal-dependent hydrolase